MMYNKNMYTFSNKNASMWKGSDGNFQRLIRQNSLNVPCVIVNFTPILWSNVGEASAFIYRSPPEFYRPNVARTQHHLSFESSEFSAQKVFFSAGPVRTSLKSAFLWLPSQLLLRLYVFQLNM